MSFMDKISSFFGLEDEEYMEAPASSSPAPSIRKTATKSQNTVEKQRDQSPKYNSQSTTNINQGAKSAASPTSRQTPRHNTKESTRIYARSQQQSQAVQADEPAYEYQKQPEKKIVAMHKPQTQNQRQEKSGQASKIMIIEPRAYSEAMAIAKHVMSGESVLVNFHLIEEYQARRIVDFLTGTVYAEDGDIKRVGNEIFLCTPKGIEIDGTAQSLVDNNFFDIDHHV
ncbi:MAG TPA: cell division protein SepF [Candidatus Tetragenococcus pullicola]|nr:cell division protein SepF [Candidatus Tetragenococcus pullicola]